VVGLGLTSAVAVASAAPAAAAHRPGADASPHSYAFDHNFSDADGGPPAEVHGNAPLVTGRTGGADRAVSLSSGGYVQFPAPAFAYGSGDFTLDMWLSTRDADGTVLDTRGCDGAGGFAVTIDGGRVRLVAGGATEPQRTAPRADDGRWHDVTVARSGMSLRVAVDGVTEDAAALPGGDVVMAGGATLGRASCAGGAHGDDDAFTGEIDDLDCSPPPPTAVPEAPLAALLPAGAVCAGGIAMLVRRRRRTR
jgi:hypothetical protein